MLTKEQLHELGKQDPELTEYLAANPFPGVPWDRLDILRQNSAAGAKQAEAAMGPTPDDLEEPIQVVKARDGFELQNRVVKPKKSPPGGSPLILTVHGGGFIMGNPVTQVPIGRALARLFGAVVVHLHYRLAPEYAFPTQQHDIIDNAKWFAANAASFGADPAKGFIIGGSSAGGQLSAITAQALADEGVTPKLTGLWQNITIVLAAEIVPEKYKEHWISRSDPNCENAIILSTKDTGAVDTHWKPDYHSPLFSPFNSKTALKGIPRTYFQVSGQDPLRDDSFVFEDALKEVGVETKLDVYPGLPHGFNSLLPNLKASTKWKLDLAKGLGWLLGREVTNEQLKVLAS